MLRFVETIDYPYSCNLRPSPSCGPGPTWSRRTLQIELHQEHVADIKQPILCLGLVGEALRPRRASVTLFGVPIRDVITDVSPLRKWKCLTNRARLIGG